ncbi:MAG: RrF2 family transcriptional regulator [Phycisphaerae bacterium]
MQLSKRTQYGIRAMVCLAESYARGYLQTRELASREGLPTKFLESILSALTRGKFLTSRIGATGGYRLARPAKDILVGEIISRLEGKKLLQEADGPPDELRPGELAVYILQEELSNAIGGVLNTITLAQLAEKVGQKSRGGQMFYI